MYSTCLYWNTRKFKLINVIFSNNLQFVVLPHNDSHIRGRGNWYSDRALMMGEGHCKATIWPYLIHTFIIFISCGKLRIFPAKCNSLPIGCKAMYYENTLCHNQVSCQTNLKCWCRWDMWVSEWVSESVSQSVREGGRKGGGGRMEGGSSWVGEWVSDIEVHVISISRVIITHTLEL